MWSACFKQREREMQRLPNGVDSAVQGLPRGLVSVLTVAFYTSTPANKRWFTRPGRARAGKIGGNRFGYTLAHKFHCILVSGSWDLVKD